jgi:hypothetical protein
MTVHSSADAANLWNSPTFKERMKAYATLEHEIHCSKVNREKMLALPLMVKDCFRLLDDLQRICHSGCKLDDADIGSIQAKLILLRINLNVHHGVSTEQLGQSKEAGTCG